MSGGRGGGGLGEAGRERNTTKTTWSVFGRDMILSYCSWTSDWCWKRYFLKKETKRRKKTKQQS